ncbi:MAG: hypothetical protein KAI66_16215 [Lentisphaeria bacterium]|nr:hypothetical protein [Lentisphaeria bacterium]
MNTNKTLPALMLALLIGGCVEYNDRPIPNPNSCTPSSCLPGICIDGDAGPYCLCGNSYRPGDDLTCIPHTMICINDQDCTSGYCQKNPGDAEGICTTPNCVTDSDCVNSIPGETAEMCCVEVDVGYSICIKIAEGYACGDGTGTCGTSCTGTADSACELEYPCLRSSDSDPNAICSAPCATDADCSACEWSESPEAKIRCVTIYDGDKYCLVVPLADCANSLDCAEDETCTIGVNVDYTDLYGQCSIYGALPPGSACNDEDDPSYLSHDERCNGLYCFGGMCSEVCSLDIDCPEGMSCLEHTFEDVDDSIMVCKGD